MGSRDDEGCVDQQQGGRGGRHQADHVVAVGGKRDAGQESAEGVADVSGGAEVGAGGDPLLAREDVEPVGVAGRPARRRDHLDGDHHGHEADHAADLQPGEVEHGLDQGADGPHPLRPEPVAQLPQGYGEEERDGAGDRQAEPDPRGGEPDDLGEEDRAAGEEDAVTEGRQHRLRGQSADERGGSREPEHPRRQVS